MELNNQPFHPQIEKANAALPGSAAIDTKPTKINWQDLKQSSNLYEELVKFIEADQPELLDMDSIARELAKHEENYYKSSGLLRDHTDINKKIGEDASSYSVIGAIVLRNNPKFLPLLKALLLDSCPDALYYKPLLKNHIERDIESLNTWLRPLRKDKTIKNYLIQRVASLEDKRKSIRDISAPVN